MDLSKVINTNLTGQAINDEYEANNKPRTHLGLSEIGHPCPRYLWYCHHGYQKPTPEGRVLRLFKLGDLIEDQVVEDLRNSGFKVEGQQTIVEFEHEGLMLTGRTDGIITGLVESKQPHLLEIKSASEKRFNELKKSGYEEWDRKYKAQIHAYAAGLELNNILVVVYNKNNSEIYTERIKTRKTWITDLLLDVFAAIRSEVPPERKCPRADWFEAKWCD